MDWKFLLPQMTIIHSSNGLWLISDDQKKWWVGYMGFISMPSFSILFTIFCWWVGLCSLPVIYLGPNYGGGNEDNGDLLKRSMQAPLHSVPPTQQQATADPRLHHTYIWNLEKWYWRIYLQGNSGETDIENRLMDMGRGEETVRCMERLTWKLSL